MNGMTHREKVDHLIAYLGNEGVHPYTVAPPLFRLLWALGINVPPPFFLGFFTLLLFMGGLFGTGVYMWLALAWHLPRELAVVTSTSAGLFFGLILAAYYRWKAAQLQLPPWDSYPGH
jgi:uncharacterized membrane protein YfcA